MLAQYNSKDSIYYAWSTLLFTILEPFFPTARTRLRESAAIHPGETAVTSLSAMVSFTALTKRTVAIACVGTALAGCASSLNVYDSSGTKIKGVPFRASEIYLRSGIHNKHSEKGDDCTPTQYVQTVTLATGAQFYANVDPAQLATTGFTMKLTDAGSLSEITLNTQPSAADTAKAAGDLLTAALPLLGVAAAAAPAAAPVKQSAPACDAGDDPSALHFTRFDNDKH